jgi:predicted TIM-barrel fold metal-dependent hydrolase
MIDAHTHLHPPRLFAAIRRWFAERSDWDLRAQPTEPADVAATLRAAGVERFVFCSYAHKAGMARELNAWLAQTARDLDGFGVPLATVHPEDPEPLADLRAALDDGCVGLKLHEDVQRVAIDDERLRPIFDELARRGAFVLAHVGPIPWAYPPNDGLARVRRVLEAHPALNVVVAHMGAPDTRGYFDLMARYPRLHLDTTMVFAGGGHLHGDATIDAALLAAHAGRIVYGTDYPNVPYPYERERDGLAAYRLAEAAMRAILHDNAARLLSEAGVR